MAFVIGVAGVWAKYTSVFEPRCSLTGEIQVEVEFKSFDSALAMYRLNAGTYPSTGQGLKALLEKPETDPVPRRWVQTMLRIPSDPWGHPYLYRFPGSRNPEKPEIVSMGRDGVPGTRDDLNCQLDE